MQKGLKKYFVNMDDYLASFGLYRKMVARDASCLFRAVSEQLYYSQQYHQRVRRECANFMRSNNSIYEMFVEGSFEKYLERLEDPKETAGEVEIKALSSLYGRRFLIYRYPGKPPTVIGEEDTDTKVMLSCSPNGHYDIVYSRTLLASAALCQSLVYELLYTRVLGVEEGDLAQALEAFQGGSRRYRSSLSGCSDADMGYDMPEERPHREEWESHENGAGDDEKSRAQQDDTKPSVAMKLALPYKVLKALDPDLYRNVEYEVWLEARKEMQKTDYMVFAGRQYFLGDKCQVRLEPKGKFYNAFIQEVGNHASAATVFIEELGEKHLVPLANLKPVNPVPAWNAGTPSRKGPTGCYRAEQYPGELDDSRGQRSNRQRCFRKSRGGKPGELLLMPTVSCGGRSHTSHNALPPRFQPAPPPRQGFHPPPPGAMAYEPYAPHHHPLSARPHRYGPSSSTRFMNRHLIGPDLAYYHPGRRFYHSYDNSAFRSRRSRRHLSASINKDSHFVFSTETGEEESQDLDGAMAYYQLEEGNEATFSHLPGQPLPPPSMVGPPATSASPYWVQRGPAHAQPPSAPGTQAAPPTPEEAQDGNSTMGEEDASYQSPVGYSVTESTANLEGDACTDSPPESITNYSYCQQVVKSSVIISSPSSSSSSSSSHTATAPPLATPVHNQLRTVAYVIPAASPWLVNELGEPVGTMVVPPPYSYDPNGSDLPRDCRVLQYYFNLGVQCYQQNYWQHVAQLQQQPLSSWPEEAFSYQLYPSYPPPPPSTSDPPTPAPPQPCPEAGRNPSPHMAPYTDHGRSVSDGQTDGQTEGPNGLASSLDAPPPAGPVSGPAPTGHLYPDQPLIPSTYEAPPSTYPASLPPHPPSYHLVTPSWAAGVPAPGPLPRLYCPSPNSASHVIGYITTPHYSTAHYTHM